MGRDKRFLEIDGVPLVVRVRDALAAVSDALRGVTHPGARARDEIAGGRVGRAGRPHAGPLGGMESAALAASSPVVLVVAADAPWLATPLLAELVARLRRSPEIDAAAVATERGPQPLLAAYRRDALAMASGRLLDAGERRATRILDALRADVLPSDTWRHFDPSGRSVLNLNEPADLGRSA